MIAKAFFFLFLCIQVCQGSNCQTAIKKSTIADSWQSSSYSDKTHGLLCFSTRETVTDYKFFHSAIGAPTSDDKFHWFAIKLNQLIAITHVVITAREKTPSLYNRSIGIEIWTSSMADVELGSEHCNSPEIGLQFEKTKSNWTLCGTTRANSEKHALDLPVTCSKTSLTRFLVLRKDMESGSYMGFNNTSIKYLEFDVQQSTSQLVKQNSTINVRCATNCGSTDASTDQLQLCLPSRKCMKTLERNITNVQPSDSGKYTCKFDGQNVTSGDIRVQYPPTDLKMISTPGHVICSAESPTNVSFEFVSSAADPPPEHRCTAVDSVGKQIELMKQEAESVEQLGSVRSKWLCNNCSLSDNVTVSCTAMQQGLWNRTLKYFWSCAVVGSPVNKNYNALFIVIAGLLSSIVQLLLCFLLFQRHSRSASDRTDGQLNSLPMDTKNIVQVDSEQPYESTAYTVYVK